MKKVVLLFAMTVITGLVAYTQCTPDPQFTTPGFYPNYATGLSSSCVGVAYDQLITNVVPSDTTINMDPLPQFTLSYDSIVIVSITGLPPGFSYGCFDGENVSSPVDQCAFEGGTIGCISIFGTPNPGDEGTYPLNIVFVTHLEGQAIQPFTTEIDYYSIEVLPVASCSNGIGEGTSTTFTLYPNPVAELFTLAGLEGLDVSNISITNAEGKVLSSFSNINKGSSFDMNVSDLDGGIYFVRITHGTSSDVVRFIKE